MSNGPGDPTMASSTIENIKKALGNIKEYPLSPVAKQSAEVPIPFFGICLGRTQFRMKDNCTLSYISYFPSPSR